MHNISESSQQCLGRPHEALGLVSGLKGLTRVLGGILFCALLHSPVQAASGITLVWDPSVGTNVSGYRIYYGAASRTYTSMVEAGNTTSASIPALVEGTTYYFTVRVYDSLGEESDYSNEIRDTPPMVAARLQTRAAPTGHFILTVTGEVGRTYSIQASSNLTTWTVIGTGMMPAGGSLDFIDTNAANFLKRFYRTQ